MPSLKSMQAEKYEEQFNSILIKSTFINTFQTELNHFHGLQGFEKGKERIIIEFEKQLFMLSGLRAQIDHFKDSNEGIEKLTAALEKSFDQYDEQEKKYRSELVNLLLPNFLAYFKENNKFSIDLLAERLPLLITELNTKDNAEDQLNPCLQLIEDHFSVKGIFKDSLEFIKNSYPDKPELSQFIFIAREEAFSLLEEKIKDNLSILNIKEVKDTYDRHLVLFFNSYQENIIDLVKYYQEYQTILTDIENKLEFLETHVGDPIKDWLDEYRQLSHNFHFSKLTLEKLKLELNKLSDFKKKLKMDNSQIFLTDIKAKTQKFLDHEIKIANQQLQEYKSSLEPHVSEHELEKITQTKQLHYSDIEKKYLERKQRLKLISELEDLKNFNKHLPEKLFTSDSLDLEKMALHSAFIFLEEPNPINQTEIFSLALSNIPLHDLEEKIFLILENRNIQQLPDSINNLLQFINRKSTDPILNEAKNYLAHSLKTFFICQSEKTAFCILQALDHAPLNITLEDKNYQNLLNYLRLIDLTELEKWPSSNLSLKEKIKESYKHDIQNSAIEESIERLILTKKLLNLFEGEKNDTSQSIKDTSTYSLWDACCLFQEFYGNFNTQVPFLKGTRSTKNSVHVFSTAVENLNALIRTLVNMENKKPHCLSFLFLSQDSNKQQCMKQLIEDLKKIPILQADKKYINEFFEEWYENNKQIINKPRHRLLIKLFMLLYRSISKLFSSVSFQTQSYQTVNELQKLFSEACADLEKVKSDFHTFSELNENLAAESERSFTPLRQ